LDACVERFKQLPVTEDCNKQIEVKSAMKQFVRLYEFLTALMDIARIDWEKKNTFFHFLLRKLPKIEKEDWAEGLLDLVDFDKYRVVRGGDKKIKLENENCVIDPIPVGQGTSITPDPDLATLEQIIDDFNLVFGDIEWGDPDTVRHQIRQVVTQLQQNDEVRDSMLNNDEDMQIQVIHDNISTKLGVVTANSSEMQRRYLSQPSIQAQLDNLVLMRLQEQINPAINEQLLSDKLIEEFNSDFKELCGVSYRSLEEVVEWFFKVLDTETIPSLDGLKKLKRTINLIYRTQGRTEDLQDWLKLLLDRFEAYMKKMYYIANHIELTREDGGFVQFLDAAKALNVNRLHYTGDSKLANFKIYYEFVHAQRNAESHTAPVREDTHVPVGIHMAMAMYLYATMINVTEMESEEGVKMYPVIEDSTSYSMVAEP
jgi:type I restriction enzyme R subunit